MAYSSLLKVLPVVGAAGGPIIFFGASSTNTEGPRQFKWFVNLDLKDLGSTWETLKGEGYWLEGLQKKTWQGVSAEEWEKLSGTTGRSVYKLAFRKQWTQEADKNAGENSARGAVGLIKASWGGGDKKLKVEEIQVSDERKVWLIIAKGQDSIYLIPVVRSANGKVGGEDKKIDQEGVQEIKEWTKKFDQGGEEWEKKHNECLEKEYSSGIIITRAGSFVKNEEGKIKELKRRGLGIVYYEDGQERGSGWDLYDQQKPKGQRLSLNAGKIMGKRLVLSCKRRGEGYRYFPLDVAVLGNSKTLNDKSDSSKNLNQMVTIEDNITKVIGVRLDQVVISETGIGDGKENQINWGTVSKPLIIRELLK